MRTHTIDGGWFGDCLPTGEWVSLIGRLRIETSFGPVGLPERGGDFLGPRYLRMSNEPSHGFQMAGQSDGQPGTWVYRANSAEKWTLDPRISHGESAHIFDLNGNLLIIEPAANQTSQGFRYLTEDGIPVRGDSAILFDDISQPSTFGNIVIGQSRGLDEGVVIHRGSERRQLFVGSASFIRVRKSGNQFSVAFVASGRTEFRWFTIDDISSFPIQREIPPPPPIVIIDPPPVKSMTYPLPARVRAIIEALYSRYVVLAEGTDDDRRALTLKCAQQICFEFGSKWGTKSADSGRPPSKDAIAYFDGITLYSADCFNGTTKKPSVPDQLEESPGQHFISVTPINHLGAPDSGGVVVIPGVPSGDLAAALVAAGGYAKSLETVIADLLLRVKALEARPVNTSTPISINGVTIALKTENGHYLGAEGGGGSGVYADRTEVKGWEKLTIEVQ